MRDSDRADNREAKFFAEFFKVNTQGTINLAKAAIAAKNQTFLISDGEDLSTPELIRRLAKYK